MSAPVQSPPFAEHAAAAFAKWWHIEGQTVPGFDPDNTEHLLTELAWEGARARALDMRVRNPDDAALVAAVIHDELRMATGCFVPGQMPPELARVIGNLQRAAANLWEWADTSGGTKARQIAEFAGIRREA